MPAQVIIKTPDGSLAVQYPSPEPKYGSDGTKTVTARMTASQSAGDLVVLAQDDRGWFVSSVPPGNNQVAQYGVVLETAVADEWVLVHIGGIYRNVKLPENVDTSTSTGLQRTASAVASASTTLIDLDAWGIDVSETRGNNSVKDINFLGEPVWVL